MAQSAKNREKASIELLQRSGNRHFGERFNRYDQAISPKIRLT
ncbi:hypothetical protein [Anabaena sp. CCY 9910]